MRVLAVHEADLREFIDRDYGRLVAGLSLMCGSTALAEDAVQEATARAVERISLGDPIDHLQAWIAVVARNVARSGLRRLTAEWRARERTRGDLRFASDPDIERLDLVEAIRRLRPQQREAVALFYFADMSIEEVAKAMALHPEAVKGLLHRSRASLARALHIPEEESL